MPGKKFGLGSLLVAVACLATVADSPGTALAQQVASPTNARSKRGGTRKSVAKSRPRPKEEGAAKTVADRFVLRDGKNLLGQLVESSNDGFLTVVARRDLVRKTLPNWAVAWEAAEKETVAAALQQRHERLVAWRRDRPVDSAVGDRVTTWLDRELNRDAGTVASPTLMAIRLDRDEVSAIERRSDSAAQVSTRGLGAAISQSRDNRPWETQRADRGSGHESYGRRHDRN